jgi:hypothetical protein
MFDADNEWIVRIQQQLRQYADVRQRLPLHAEPFTVPTRPMLAELLEVAFWASLRSNEGRPTRVRIALLPAGSVGDVLAFKQPVRYTEDEVAKLAPAASSTGWIAVDLSRPQGTVWGISTNTLDDSLGAVALDISDPGVIRVTFGPFHSFVVLAGRSTTASEYAKDEGLTVRLAAALGKELATQNVGDSTTAWRECHALSILARQVLEDRHGGMLLVVPDSTGAWQDSLHPFTHQFAHADTSIRDSVVAAQHQRVSSAAALRWLGQTHVSGNLKEAILASFSQLSWHPESVLRPIAQLAAVDGAVVLTSDLNVLGFGGMVSAGSVPDVYLVNSLPDQTRKIQIEEAGGARHQAGVRFVGQNRQAVSLVISHDGHLALAYWSSERDGVALHKNAERWL